MDSDPTAVKMRLSKSQMSLIWLGLDFVVRAYLTRVRTGSAQFEYPFHVLPLPLGSDAGTFGSAMMDRMLALWTRLKPKAKAGGRFQMNGIEIRAAILAARVTLQLRRKEVKEARRWDSATKRRFRMDGESIRELEGQTERLIMSLELYMKRANRAFLKEASRNQFADESKEWRSHLRWIRWHLIFFKPFRSLLQGRRKWQQAIIDQLVVMAEEAIHYQDLEPPDPRELRRVIRLFARYARRGRTGSFHLRRMLENPKSRLAQYHLADFVQQRFPLKECQES